MRHFEPQSKAAIYGHVQSDLDRGRSKLLNALQLAALQAVTISGESQAFNFRPNEQNAWSCHKKYRS